MQCFEYNISWHINAVSLEYESNPFEYTNLTWSCDGRMKSDGLNFFCTSKGFKGEKDTINFHDWNDVWKGCCSLCDNDRQIISGHYAELIWSKI